MALEKLGELLIAGGLSEEALETTVSNPLALKKAIYSLNEVSEIFKIAIRMVQESKLENEHTDLSAEEARKLLNDREKLDADIIFELAREQRGREVRRRNRLKMTS